MEQKQDAAGGARPTVRPRQSSPPAPLPSAPPRCPWPSLVAGLIVLALWAGALILSGRVAERYTWAPGSETLFTLMAHALGLRSWQPR